MFLPRKDGWEALAALCLLTMPTPVKLRCVCVCIVIPHWRGAGSLVCALAPLREWPQPLDFRSTTASKGSQQREEGLTEKGRQPAAGGCGLEAIVLWAGKRWVFMAGGVGVGDLQPPAS